MMTLPPKAPKSYAELMAEGQAPPPPDIETLFRQEEAALQDFPLCRGLLVHLYQRPDLLADACSKITDADLALVGNIDCA